MDSARSFIHFLESTSEHEEDIVSNNDWLAVDLCGSDVNEAGKAISESSITDAGDARHSLQTCEDSENKIPRNSEVQVEELGRNQAEISGQFSSELFLPMPTFLGTGSLEYPGSDTLEELVDRLKRADCDSAETKELGVAILTHPDHLKDTSNLKVYSKLNGGLKYYSPGTAQAWLYNPKKRKREIEHEDESDSAVLVLVYPEISVPRSKSNNTSKMAFHFGGRANSFGVDGRLKIQYGSCGALGLRARKFQLAAAKKRLPSDSQTNQFELDENTPRSSSSKEFTSEHFTELLKQTLPSLASIESNLDYASLDACVKDVRKDLEGSNLKYVKAVLIEVWNREVATQGAPARTSLTKEEVLHAEM